VLVTRAGAPIMSYKGCQFLAEAVRPGLICQGWCQQHLPGPQSWLHSISWLWPCRTLANTLYAIDSRPCSLLKLVPALCYPRYSEGSMDNQVPCQRPPSKTHNWPSRNWSWVHTSLLSHWEYLNHHFWTVQRIQPKRGTLVEWWLPASGSRGSEHSHQRGKKSCLKDSMHHYQHRQERMGERSSIQCNNGVSLESYTLATWPMSVKHPSSPHREWAVKQCSRHDSGTSKPILQGQPPAGGTDLLRWPRTPP